MVTFYWAASWSKLKSCPSNSKDDQTSSETKKDQDSKDDAKIKGQDIDESGERLRLESYLLKLTAIIKVVLQCLNLLSSFEECADLGHLWSPKEIQERLKKPRLKKYGCRTQEAE